ncbi:hypothetical protein CYY_001050 [Polysphondylium violaceum]|uniref:Uncharacterized protein n=1 Tax=Polysphondylium violaceum TaxID=133409 RepID=A0A8J4Q0H2_9MYCE|nr:hypothetical protein CYY_001050 [Polysphondylium violaceum]
MGIYSYLGNNDMGWEKKKGADSHATPRPEKQTQMNKIRETNTTQFLVPPVSALKIDVHGDVNKGGNKSRNVSFNGR